jgi:4-hydroxythreonine-4-phosphate dehydrogenase
MVIGKINVLNVWRESFDLEYGKVDPVVGKYAIKSFTEATNALKEGWIDVLVTAPIHKFNIQSEEFAFPGHTDYLNQEIDGEALMLMVSDSLRIGLLTDHIPVQEVSKVITAELLENKIKVLKQTLVQDFNIQKPKIAILGLNPHCGDQGVIGKEDDVIIAPTIKRLFDSGVYAFGPYAADSFFGSNTFKQFDGILACYHDQGLIPFKTLSFGQGVNFTAGLNKVRTSPDHGTAMEIAGKNKADPNSFKEAVYLALDVFKSRQVYAEISESPLKIRKMKLE